MALENDTATAEIDAKEEVATIVAEKQERADGSETVGAFTDDVEAQAKERVAEIRDMQGEKAVAVVGPEIMAEAKSYGKAREDILDPNAKVDDTAAIGAAAYVDMGTREITHDRAAMNFEMTAAEEDYRRRTQAHEEVHQQDQAAQYNATELHIVDESGAVKTFAVEGDLTEGHATQENEVGDLTPDYVAHQQAWHEITDTIDEGKLRNAMKTGDIAAIQREHIREVLEDRFALAA